MWDAVRDVGWNTRTRARALHHRNRFFPGDARSRPAQVGAEKPCSLVGNATSLPIASMSADVVLASFVASYMAEFDALRPSFAVLSGTMVGAV